MVEFESVSKVYPDGTVAVDALNLTIEKGKIVVLIGPSGCGKTTSLKMANRLEEPSSGVIRMGGENILKMNPVALRRNIGYVIQDTGLMPHLTVTENIATVPNLLKWKKDRVQARVEELLHMAGLDPKLYRYRLPAQMSGGQRQRIGVLRALAAEPEVVLMDEPFGALDPITRDKLQGELKEIQKTLQRTIIFVTHDIDEALKLGDEIVLMKNGRVEQIGSPDELQQNPANAFVESFIGEDRLAQITPEAGIDALVEDAPLVLKASSGPEKALERMERVGRETAQVVDEQGQWKGMVWLNDIKNAERYGKPIASTYRTKRRLRVEDARIREAATLLAESSEPIPVVNAKGRLVGIFTDAGFARMTIARLTRGQKTKESA